MIETGVNLTLNDNASAAARRVADGFGEVATAADGINSALDPRVLDQYNQKLTEIGEAYSKLNRGISQQNRTQAQEMQHAQQIFAGMGTSMVQAGRGDVAGGALSGVKSLAGLAGKISPAVAAGLAATAGLGLAGNALANIYGERSGPAGDIARLQGDMGTDIASNTLALRDAMSSTTNAVKAYGKTFEEGAAAAQTFLKAGGSNFAGTSQAAAYSLAMGADFNRLAGFEGMTQRYGAGSLATVDALRMAQGLDPKHFEEVMGGYQDIVSSRLGRGISGGGGDIARQLEFFSNAGVAWQGALGAQKVQGLNQAVAGAGGLQQQSDLFLYRAAAGITPGGSMIDIKKRMEGGLTQEMFKGLMGEFGRIGYGETESILQLSKMFGLSTTDAEALYNLRGQGLAGTQYEGLGGLGAGAGATIETGYQANIEGVKQWVSQLGEGFYDLRAKGIDGTIEGFKNLMLASENLSNAFNEYGSGLAETGEGYGSYSGRQQYRTFKAGVTRSKGIRGVSEFIAALEEAEKAGVSEAQILATIGRPYSLAMGGDARTNFIDESEGKTLNQLIMDLIAATDRTTDAVNSDTVLEDDRGASGSSTFSGFRD